MTTFSIWLTAVALAAATAPVTPSGPAPSAVKGQAFAERHCARCHAIGLTGSSPYPIAPAFRDIAKRYPPEDLEEALGEGIMVGHPEMPKFKLEEPRILDLVEYFKSLRQPQAADAGGRFGAGHASR